MSMLLLVQVVWMNHQINALNQDAGLIQNQISELIQEIRHEVLDSWNISSGSPDTCCKII